MELTKEQEKLFEAGLDEDNIPHDNSFYLCRYLDDIGFCYTTKYEDYYDFRLTEAEELKKVNDEYEGEKADEYYQEAIFSLFKENKMSESLYNTLKDYKTRQEIMFSYQQNDTRIFYDGEYIAYILCFSKNIDDEYMKLEYAKNFIKLFGIDEYYANQHSGDYYVMKVLPILYGDDAKEFVRSKILKYLNDKELSHKEYFINDILNELKYVIKGEKNSDGKLNRKENEVRLVVFVDKKKFNNIDEVFIDEDKKHMHLKIYKKGHVAI